MHIESVSFALLRVYCWAVNINWHLDWHLDGYLHFLLYHPVHIHRFIDVDWLLHKLRHLHRLDYLLRNLPYHLFYYFHWNLLLNLYILGDLHKFLDNPLWPWDQFGHLYLHLNNLLNWNLLNHFNWLFNHLLDDLGRLVLFLLEQFPQCRQL